jgi:hypothetical protein
MGPRVNRPAFELPPEVGQTSKGFMKKYPTGFKLKGGQSFWLETAGEAAGAAVVCA